MTKTLKVNNAIEAFLIFSLSFSLPFISYRLDKISFQTNDDFGIKSFLAGYSIGEPRPQLVRIFEPLDFTLRTLYQMNPNISWYVYLFFLIQALSYSVIASILITKIKKLELTEQAVLVVALMGVTVLFSLVFFYLQYTQVAIIAAGIGTLGIIFRTKKTELLISILILIIGILVRPQAAMPASLIIFLIACGLLYINEKEISKDLYKRLFLAVLLALGTYLIYLLSYNSWAPWISEDAKELVKRQESVRNIYDYGPFADAKKLKLAAARDVGFSKNDNELIELYYFADQTLFDSEKLSALESAIKDRKDLSVYKKILHEFVFVFLDNNKIYFIFFFGLSVLIFIKMTPYPIKSLIFMIGVMLSIYLYTILQGKIPFAVFYATALIALSGILVISVNVKKINRLHSRSSDKEKIRNFLTLFLITFSIFFGYKVLLLNSDKINQNLYWRSSYFLKASEVDKFKNFEYDKPIVAFSSFYTQLEQTQNPISVSAADKKIWAQTVDIGWTLFEPEYLLHIQSLGLSEDLFSSVARGDAYVGTANPFEIQVLSQYLREHRNLRVTWVLLPIADQRSSASGLSVWKVGTARPLRKESN
jgi:hypothetical protein